VTPSQQPDDKPTPAQLPEHTAVRKPAPPAGASRSIEDAKAFGKVGEDGTVYVLLRGEEIAVGAYPDATAEEALTYFARKYEEAEAQLALLESRLQRKTAAQEAAASAAKLRELLAERGMVGDIARFEERLAALESGISRRAEEERAEAAEAKERNLAEREAIVRAAEEVAAQDPQQTHWKNSSARMSDLFDTWKAAQRSARLPKSTEDELWKRFRTARTAFDKHRRAYFSQLDQSNAQAKRAKEGLIAEAEALSDSTDWAGTAAKYRDLMDRWKRAPRASRREDDALWARFRAAQDVFFHARAAANEETEREFEANLKVKEELLRQARQILPVTDVEAAKAALHPILDQWDAAGMVPRRDLRRIEGELQKVQNAIEDAQQARWERSNPETQARAESMLSQLEETISGLEAELDAARRSGDAKAASKAEEALEARRKWLDQLRASSGETSEEG
jgi:hypothetical protein